MLKTKDGYKFETTGRQFYANAFIGIQQRTDGTFEIAQGYDGSIDLEDENGISLYDENEMQVELSQPEKIELANYMIDLWKKFAGIDKNEQLPNHDINYGFGSKVVLNREK